MVQDTPKSLRGSKGGVQTMSKGPKQNNDFLPLRVPHDLKLRLLAVSFFLGFKDAYAPSAKKFLEEGYKRFVDGLTPSKRQEFENILSNVHLADSTKTLVEKEKAAR